MSKPCNKKQNYIFPCSSVRSPFCLLSARNSLLNPIPTPFWRPAQPNPDQTNLSYSSDKLDTSPSCTFIQAHLILISRHSIDNLRRSVPVVGQAGAGRPHSSKCWSRDSSRHRELWVEIVEGFLKLQLSFRSFLCIFLGPKLIWKSVTNYLKISRRGTEKVRV